MKDDEGREMGLHGWRTLKEYPFIMSAPNSDARSVCSIGHACDMSGQRALTFVEAGRWPQLICYGGADELRPCYDAIVQVVESGSLDVGYLVGLSFQRAVERPDPCPVPAEVWLAAYERAMKALATKEPDEISMLIEEAHYWRKHGRPRDPFAILGFYDSVPRQKM